MKLGLFGFFVILYFASSIATKKVEHEQSAIELKSFMDDIGNKIEKPEYVRFSSDAERDKIRTRLKAIREWMEEDDETIEDTKKADDYNDRMIELKSLTTDIFYRYDQAKVLFSRYKDVCYISTLKIIIGSTESI